jgi:hypothetical protein
MREGRFTILDKDPTIYLHTRLCPVIYMGTVVTEWEMQWVLSISTGTRDCGDECEAESKPCGNATLLRCPLSAVVKSLSEKCLLHKYLLHIILVESIVQNIATFLAHTTAL